MNVIKTRRGKSLTLALTGRLDAVSAFVAGIPTAISYEVVACGNRRGFLHEILNAETLSQVIVNNQDKLEIR